MSLYSYIRKYLLNATPKINAYKIFFGRIQKTYLNDNVKKCLYEKKKNGKIA